MSKTGKLNVYEFGEQLLSTGDLDPVYILLWEAQIDRLYEWLLAYWCFYHMGTASWIVDQPKYWKAMEQAAASKDWPRCPERRHFRGQNAIKSVAYLKDRGIHHLFRPLQETRQTSLTHVMKQVQQWVGFGPWIAFKVADMLERLSICNVDFDNIYLFDSPKEGAQLVYDEDVADGTADEGLDPQEYAVDALIDHFSETSAPPQYERVVNLQEAETILCKYKSYSNGRYHIGEDIVSCRKSLMRFARCKTAQRLLKAGKTSELWLNLADE